LLAASARGTSFRQRGTPIRDRPPMATAALALRLR